MGIYSSLTFTCTKSHGPSPLKEADEASYVRTFVLHFNCFFFTVESVFYILKYETQSLITKCHNKWLHIISNINYHCAPYSFMKQSMRVESFFSIRIQLIQCNCLTAGGISTPSLPYSPVWASLKSGAVIICRCSSWQGNKKQMRMQLGMGNTATCPRM